MDIVSLQLSGGDHTLPAQPQAGGVEFRAPTVDDGPAIAALIADCPPLDRNSTYCNLLQCTHFAATCVVAERTDRVVGWLSAYRLPDSPDTLFVWQMAVADTARGEGLAARLLDELLIRSACAGVRRLRTTITPGNAASWAVFRRLAQRLNAPITDAPWLIAGRHLPEGHETEHLVTIGPFSTAPGVVVSL